MANRAGCLVAALMTATISMTAAAAAKTTLKFSFFSPTSHPWWTLGGQVFVDKVKEFTKGEVDFELYPASQLGGDFLGLIRYGLADIVMVPAGYIAEKLPLSGVAELPGFQDSSCDGARKLSILAKNDGVLDRYEYKPLGIKVIYVGQGSPYPILTATKPITKIEDLAGMKLRTLGGVQGSSARALGAVPIQVAATELYDTLSRGTADGTIYGFASMKVYHLDNVLHHSLEGVTFGSSGVFVSMSEKRWNALPDTVKDAFEKAGAIAERSLCESWDKQHADTRDELVKAGKLTRTSLSADELAKARAMLAPIADEWAKALDKTGRKGSEVLKAYREIGAGN